MVPPLCNAFDLDALRKQGATPVFLIRHGETQWNRERRFLGRSDVPLNNTGQHQAQLLADRLRAVPFNHVYSSPLTRAVETAGGIGATHGLPVVRIPGLAELDQGELEGKLAAALVEEYPAFFNSWRRDPTHARIPGGETLAECQARCVAAMHSVLREHTASDTIAIVSHKVAISGIICDAIGLPPRFNMMVHQANTAINVLAWHQDQLKLVRLNDRKHLAATAEQRAEPRR